jgi:hypothetical protein
MIADKEEIINQLQANISILKNLYEKEKMVCNQLKAMNSDLSKKIEQKNFEIESLEVKLSTLKLAKSISGNNNDMHDAKVKVTDLVREIDKCIALLNR